MEIAKIKQFHIRAFYSELAKDRYAAANAVNFVLTNVAKGYNQAKEIKAKNTETRYYCPIYQHTY